MYCHSLAWLIGFTSTRGVGGGLPRPALHNSVPINQLNYPLKKLHATRRMLPSSLTAYTSAVATPLVRFGPIRTGPTAVETNYYGEPE